MYKRQIFEAVTRRPIAKLFWDSSADLNNKDISRPISLSYISEKLDRQIYKTPADFVNDMRQLFLNGDCYDREDSLRPAAIGLLINDFENALAIYSPSSLSLNIKLRVTLDELENVVESPVEETTGRVTYKSEPASYFLTHYNIDPENVTIADLKHEISLLKTPKLILKVIHYIHKLQPDALLSGQGVSILYSRLTKENLSLIQTYIKKIMTDAAIGRISGLENSALREPESTIIQQIDFVESDKPERRSSRRSKN